ncbi:MAG TPA: hypothetical protein VL308_15845 [Gemmatimonadaceae bacterium]|jgi:hypothetical protein|nr:hypothetical protein [Gemmatimonadaceae bacterium]
MTQPASNPSGASSAIDPSVAWLVERAQLPEDVAPLAAASSDGAALVQALVADGKTPEAFRVIAAALPPREGVWWAWVSARHATQLAAEGREPPAKLAAALAAVEQWIANPDDDRRRAAWAAAQAAGLETAAGCAASAVFFTSGSVAPADVAPVPPPAGIDRMLAGNAVALAVSVHPQHLEALAGAYIAQGLEVVKQLGGWDKAIALSRDHFQAQQERHAQISAPPTGGAPVTQPAGR